METPTDAQAIKNIMLETTWSPEKIFPREHSQTGYSPILGRPKAVQPPTLPSEGDDTGFWLEPTGGKRSSLFTSIHIHGERFNVELDNDLGVLISHPRWSLLGHGSFLVEAEKMLMDYAQDLAESMVDDSPIEYTEEGNRLRNFVLGFLHLSLDNSSSG